MAGLSVAKPRSASDRVASDKNTVQACRLEMLPVHAYFACGVLVAGLVALSRIALVAYIVRRANRKDLPEIVRGLAHWWRK